MKITIIALGSPATDNITGATGVATHYYETSAGGAYAFRPSGLHKDTRQPLKSNWITPDRLAGAKTTQIEFPRHLLGAKATHDHSGFTGTIVALTRHINGCVHAMVQPSGRLESGELPEPTEFDVRELSGPDIPKMDEATRARSEESDPSPSPVPTGRR